jgi:hypothetical protein
VGIEPAVLQQAQLAGERDCAEWQLTQQLSQLRASGRAVMLGIDEMERLKGLPLKLLAFEQLLRTRPEIEARVALVQVGVPAGPSPLTGASGRLKRAGLTVHGNMTVANELPSVQVAVRARNFTPAAEAGTAALRTSEIDPPDPRFAPLDIPWSLGRR